MAKHLIPVSDLYNVRIGKSFGQYLSEATAHYSMVIGYQNVHGCSLSAPHPFFHLKKPERSKSLTGRIRKSPLHHPVRPEGCSHLLDIWIRLLTLLNACQGYSTVTDFARLRG